MTNPGHPEIDLSKLFNYKLWKLASVAGAPVIRLLEGRYGVSRQEMSLLSVVAREGVISPSELAARIALDRPRASKAIKILISKCLLVRQQAPGTNRRYLLELTPAGWDLVSEAFPQVLAINERVISCLDPKTRFLFEQTLQALTEHALTLNQELVSEVKANRRRAGRKAAG